MGRDVKWPQGLEYHHMRFVHSTMVETSRDGIKNLYLVSQVSKRNLDRFTQNILSQIIVKLYQLHFIESRAKAWLLG